MWHSGLKFNTLKFYFTTRSYLPLSNNNCITHHCLQLIPPIIYPRSLNYTKFINKQNLSAYKAFYNLGSEEVTSHYTEVSSDSIFNIYYSYISNRQLGWKPSTLGNLVNLCI